MHANLILDDQQVIALGSKAQIIVEFPSLRFQMVPMSGGGSGCGRCGANRALNKTKFNQVQRLKTVILGLPLDRKARLKQILDAARITLFVPGPHGVQQHSF